MFVMNCFTLTIIGLLIFPSALSLREGRLLQTPSIESIDRTCPCLPVAVCRKYQRPIGNVESMGMIPVCEDLSLVRCCGAPPLKKVSFPAELIHNSRFHFSPDTSDETVRQKKETATYKESLLKKIEDTRNFKKQDLSKIKGKPRPRRAVEEVSGNEAKSETTTTTEREVPRDSEKAEARTLNAEVEIENEGLTTELPNGSSAGKTEIPEVAVQETGNAKQEPPTAGNSLLHPENSNSDMNSDLTIAEIMTTEKSDESSTDFDAVFQEDLLGSGTTLTPGVPKSEDDFRRLEMSSNQNIEIKESPTTEGTTESKMEKTATLSTVSTDSPSTEVAMAKESSDLVHATEKSVRSSTEVRTVTISKTFPIDFRKVRKSKYADVKEEIESQVAVVYATSASEYSGETSGAFSTDSKDESDHHRIMLNLQNKVGSKNDDRHHIQHIPLSKRLIIYKKIKPSEEEAIKELIYDSFQNKTSDLLSEIDNKLSNSTSVSNSTESSENDLKDVTETSEAAESESISEKDAEDNLETAQSSRVQVYAMKPDSSESFQQVTTERDQSSRFEILKRGSSAPSKFSSRHSPTVAGVEVTEQPNASKEPSKRPPVNRGQVKFKNNVMNEYLKEYHASIPAKKAKPTIEREHSKILRPAPSSIPVAPLIKNHLKQTETSSAVPVTDAPARFDLQTTSKAPENITVSMISENVSKTHEDLASQHDLKMQIQSAKVEDSVVHSSDVAVKDELKNEVFEVGSNNTQSSEKKGTGTEHGQVTEKAESAQEEFSERPSTLLAGENVTSQKQNVSETRLAIGEKAFHSGLGIEAFSYLNNSEKAGTVGTVGSAGYGFGNHTQSRFKEELPTQSKNTEWNNESILPGQPSSVFIGQKGLKHTPSPLQTNERGVQVVTPTPNKVENRDQAEFNQEAAQHTYSGSSSSMKQGEIHPIPVGAESHSQKEAKQRPSIRYPSREKENSAGLANRATIEKRKQGGLRRGPFAQVQTDKRLDEGAPASHVFGAKQPPSHSRRMTTSILVADSDAAGEASSISQNVYDNEEELSFAETNSRGALAVPLRDGASLSQNSFKPPEQFQSGFVPIANPQPQTPAATTAEAVRIPGHFSNYQQQFSAVSPLTPAGTLPGSVGTPGHFSNVPQQFPPSLTPASTIPGAVGTPGHFSNGQQQYSGVSSLTSASTLPGSVGTPGHFSSAQQQYSGVSSLTPASTLPGSVGTPGHFSSAQQQYSGVSALTPAGTLPGAVGRPGNFLNVQRQFASVPPVTPASAHPGAVQTSNHYLNYEQDFPPVFHVSTPPPSLPLSPNIQHLYNPATSQNAIPTKPFSPITQNSPVVRPAINPPANTNIKNEHSHVIAQNIKLADSVFDLRRPFTPQNFIPTSSGLHSFETRPEIGLPAITNINNEHSQTVTHNHKLADSEIDNSKHPAVQLLNPGTRFELHQQPNQKYFPGPGPVFNIPLLEPNTAGIVHATTPAPPEAPTTGFFQRMPKFIMQQFRNIFGSQQTDQTEGVETPEAPELRPVLNHPVESGDQVDTRPILGGNQAGAQRVRIGLHNGITRPTQSSDFREFLNFNRGNVAQEQLTNSPSVLKALEALKLQSPQTPRPTHSSSVYADRAPVDGVRELQTFVDLNREQAPQVEQPSRPGLTALEILASQYPETSKPNSPSLEEYRRPADEIRASQVDESLRREHAAQLERTRNPSVSAHEILASQFSGKSKPVKSSDFHESRRPVNMIVENQVREDLPREHQAPVQSTGTVSEAARVELAPQNAVTPQPAENPTSQERRRPVGRIRGSLVGRTRGSPADKIRGSPVSEGSRRDHAAHVERTRNPSVSAHDILASQFSETPQSDRGSSLKENRTPVDGIGENQPKEELRLEQPAQTESTNRPSLTALEILATQHSGTPQPDETSTPREDRIPQGKRGGNPVREDLRKEHAAQVGRTSGPTVSALDTLQSQFSNTAQLEQSSAARETSQKNNDEIRASKIEMTRDELPTTVKNGEQAPTTERQSLQKGGRRQFTSRHRINLNRDPNQKSSMASADAIQKSGQSAPETVGRKTITNRKPFREPSQTRFKPRSRVSGPAKGIGSQAAVPDRGNPNSVGPSSSPVPKRLDIPNSSLVSKVETSQEKNAGDIGAAPDSNLNNLRAGIEAASKQANLFAQEQASRQAAGQALMEQAAVSVPPESTLLVNADSHPPIRSMFSAAPIRLASGAKHQQFLAGSRQKEGSRQRPVLKKVQDVVTESPKTTTEPTVPDLREVPVFPSRGTQSNARRLIRPSRRRSDVKTEIQQTTEAAIGSTQVVSTTPRQNPPRVKGPQNTDNINERYADAMYSMLRFLQSR